MVAPEPTCKSSESSPAFSEPGRFDCAVSLLQPPAAKARPSIMALEITVDDSQVRVCVTGKFLCIDGAAFAANRCLQSKPEATRDLLLRTPKKTSASSRVCAKASTRHPPVFGKTLLFSASAPRS